MGRNSIPIGDHNGKVVCVDLLESALEKLGQYSKEYGVNDVIVLEKADIGDYQIKQNSYDLIVAVSSLEHVASETILEHVFRQMEEGTKIDGINCIIINSGVEEIDIKTNKKVDALLEINIRTEDMIRKLQRNYDGWEVLMQLVKPLEFKIVRNNKDILLKTNAITYVVRKSK